MVQAAETAPLIARSYEEALKSFLDENIHCFKEVNSTDQAVMALNL